MENKKIFTLFKGYNIIICMNCSSIHISNFSPRAMISPSFDMPSLYMRSNSVWRTGAATLFLTTLTRTRPPMTSSPFLICAMRRMSRRTEV